MKSITVINKESHCFVSGYFLCHERKCVMSDGKHESIIVVKWISGLIQASDQIHTTYFPRVVITTKGYKGKEPYQIDFEQLQIE